MMLGLDWKQRLGHQRLLHWLKCWIKSTAVHSLPPSAGINCQSRTLVSHIITLHSEYHSEHLRKGFEDSLLTVRQSLVTVKQSSTMPSTSEQCNSLHSSLKTSVDKATSQVK
ncbi:uncharacterized protein [Dysidea avara]